MGRAIGLAGTFFAGVRVAGELTYIPQHLKNGKQINSRVIIPVYRNSHRGTNQKTGERGRTDAFKLVAWGKLADTCCRSLPKGKAIDCFCEPQSFLGNLFNVDGSLRVDASGQAIQSTKVSFTILNILFGEESAKQIAEEIQTGRRPINWNVPNHPDFQMWTQILQQKQTMVWDGQNQKFGYARVAIPQGQNIQLNFGQPAGNVNQGPQGNVQYPNNVNMGQQGNVQMPGNVQYPNQPVDANGQVVNLPNMVNYAVNNTPNVVQPNNTGFVNNNTGVVNAPQANSGQQLF